MTDFLYTDARWTKHFVEVSDPHKEGHHVRFYFERPWVGLTDEERKDIELGIEVFDMSVEDILKEAEAKLMEKNT